MSRSGVLAAAVTHRHQSVAGAIPARRPAEPGTPDSAGDRPVGGAAGAGNHRRRADRRFHPRAGDPAPAEKSYLLTPYDAGSGVPTSVRRMASRAPIARRRAISMTERMSA